MDILIPIVLLLLGAGGLSVFLAFIFREVVPTNEVHIVQRTKRAVPYGKDQEAGNVYYSWPSWVPVVGITRILLPVSNFTIDLNDYQAYDDGKVPFGVDVKAFFRVEDAPIAAQRVEHFQELKEQLTDILKGAIRKILASKDIETIMVGRGEFGQMFTEEVENQLKSWGVTSVKSIELMDIRDGQGSRVISNIMEKKKSEIEKDSRVKVAENMRIAEVKEIEAQREADVAKEQAEQAVGERAAQKDKAVGVANEVAEQEIKEQAKITAEKDMAVKKVENVKAAEINKDVAVVKAAEQKETDVIKAEGEKQQTITIAEGNLSEKQKEAEGIQAVGLAEAEAKKAMERAPVAAQIELAKEIGTNKNYMDYLLGLDGIKAGEAIGKAKAQALANSDLKVIANTGGKDGVQGGVNNIMDIFGADGGAKLGAMLDNLNNSEIGEQLVKKFGLSSEEAKKVEKIAKKVPKAKRTKKLEVVDKA